MPHSKTPGQSNAASAKHNSQVAEGSSPLLTSCSPLNPPPKTDNHPSGKGLGAANAPAAKEAGKPGEAPVASDSGSTNVGVDAKANNPGEKGIGGVNVDKKV